MSFRANEGRMTRTWRYSGALIGLVAFASCQDGKASQSDGAVFDYDGGIGATVQGYTWDPEAFFYGLATCPPDPEHCPYPPITIPKSPLFPRTIVTGAAVGLFDPAQPMRMMPLPFAAAATTGDDGSWQVARVPTRPGPPFFAVAAVGDGGGLVPAMVPMLAPIPPAHYFPTFTLKPIVTGATTLCLDQATGLIGDSGILEAVARYLKSAGKKVSAADFIDPGKYGGVAVWWLYQAGPPVLRVPAFGAYVKADQGQSFSIYWMPPGAGPAAVSAIQSARGFFVNMAGASGPGLDIAVTVVLLPPVNGPPAMVGFVPTDPVSDSTQGRPFTFPSLPPAMPIAPGIVSWGELQANTPDSPPPPDFVCVD
jgi:hypothetical protein